VITPADFKSASSRAEIEGQQAEYVVARHTGSLRLRSRVLARCCQGINEGGEIGARSAGLVVTMPRRRAPLEVEDDVVHGLAEAAVGLAVSVPPMSRRQVFHSTSG
jgi:hypothetical protein